MGDPSALAPPIQGPAAAGADAIPAALSSASLRADVELIRVAAAAMVVTIHSTAGTIVAAQAAGSNGIAYQVALIANEASKPAVPIFFAISGWLLLRRQGLDGEWLRRRVSRIALPLVFWSITYALDSVIVAAATGRRLWSSQEGFSHWVSGEVALALAGPGTRDHLWYLYFALALTVAIWLLRADVRSGPRYAVAASALIVPAAIARAFGTTVSWNTFGWAIGYAALGYWVLERRPKPTAGWSCYLAVTSVLVVITSGFGYDSWPSTYESPLIVVATIGLLLALPASSRIASAPYVPAAGRLTLGVYLVHPLVLDGIRLASRPGGWLAPLSPTPLLLVTWAGALVVSFGLSFAWHRSGTLTRLLG